MHCSTASRTRHECLSCDKAFKSGWLLWMHRSRCREKNGFFPQRPIVFEEATAVSSNQVPVPSSRRRTKGPDCRRLYVKLANHRKCPKKPQQDSPSHTLEKTVVPVVVAGQNSAIEDESVAPDNDNRRRRLWSSPVRNSTSHRRKLE